MLALKDSPGPSTGIAYPDVVALHVVLFILEHAADGVNDATITSEGERGDVLVDRYGRLVERLRLGRHRQKTGPNSAQQQCAEGLFAKNSSRKVRGGQCQLRLAF